MKPIKLKQDMEKIDLKKAGKDFAKRFTGVMSRLADEDTNTLREEFEANFLDGNKIDDCKGTTFSVSGALEIAEYFYNKFNQKLEEIEFIIKDIQSFQSDGEIGTLCEQALQIIKNKKI